MWVYEEKKIQKKRSRTSANSFALDIATAFVQMMLIFCTIGYLNQNGVSLVLIYLSKSRTDMRE